MRTYKSVTPTMLRKPPIQSIFLRISLRLSVAATGFGQYEIIRPAVGRAQKIKEIHMIHRHVTYAAKSCEYIT